MNKPKQQHHSFLYKNGLSIVLFVLFFIFLAAQSYTGWHEYNEELREKGGMELGFTHYLGSSHFIEATFENWESEFLQMAIYVMLTIFLRQKGSSESKPLEGEEEVDKEPQSKPDAPWPVRKGGLWLSLYKHSLTLAFFLLFSVSFVFHAYASLEEHNIQQALEGKPTETMSEFIGSSKLWFESFQNWQSEFIAVFSIVVLSIFLRQKGSPESKPVDAPNSETGS